MRTVGRWVVGQAGLLAMLASLPVRGATCGSWVQGPAAPAAMLSRSQHAMVYDVARDRVVLFGGVDEQNQVRNDTWELGTAAWTQGPASPQALFGRYRHMMAYDSARGLSVLVGGQSATRIFGDVWEYDGTAWVPGTAAPGTFLPRYGGSMSYDSGRARAVLFGGATSGSTLGETWEYDGSTWIAGPMALPGMPWIGHAMVYDVARARVVMFGGYQIGNGVNGTWYYDGTLWTAGPPPAAGLTGRWGHAMAYDPACRRTLEFGGYGAGTSSGWEFDGYAWSMASPDPPAGGRALAALAPSSQGVVLFGGSGTVSATATWIHQAGLSVSPPVLPGGRVGIAYSQTVAASGGAGPYTCALASGALPPGLSLAGSVLSGTPTQVGSFTFAMRVTAATGCTTLQGYVLKVVPTSCPAIALGPPALPDGAIGARYAQTLTASGGAFPYTFALSNGAIPDGLALASTGELTGTPIREGTFGFVVTATDASTCKGVATYTIMVAAGCGGAWALGAPMPARQYHAVAFDPRRGVIVLFGGGTPPRSDTWVYDGAAWIEVFPPQCPPGRMNHAMTYDSARDRTVLYGGYGSPGDLADSWSYDGTTWTLVSSAGPPARDRHGMAYDAARDRVVMFGGGIGGSPYYGDTWELDGAAWAPGPATPPALGIRFDMAMSFDATRGVTVLFGGDDGVSGQRNDTWLYDGTGWAPGPAPPVLLSERSGARMAFDATRQLCVLHGGWERSTMDLRNDTWLYDGVGWIEGPAAPPALNSHWVFDMAYDGARDRVVAAGGLQTTTQTWELLGSVTMIPSRLPDAAQGIAYAQTLIALGGTPTYAFSLSTGSLPTGLTLAPSGSLSGTPTTAGLFQFEATAIDAQGCTGKKAYDLIVRPPGCAPLTLGPANLPLATLWSSYNATVTASGGYPPTTFAVTWGALPPGLALAASGLLSGAPTVSGKWNAGITATDVTGCTGTRVFELIVRLPVDVIVGEGLGQSRGNRVQVYRRDGTYAGVGFDAYGAGQWGVNVASADLVASSHAEILTGPGPGPAFGPQVRGFNRSGAAIASINFFAYGTPRYGVNVGAGRIDADGFAEILTGPGPGTVFGPHVRGFDYDGTAVTAMPKVSFLAYATLQWGANVAAGTVDADPYDEILTGPGPGPAFAPHVRGFDYDATAVRPIAKLSFQAFATLGYGAHVAAGDVDADGFDELACAPGPGPALPARILGYGYDGAAVGPLPGFDVTPYATLFGARGAVGQLAHGLTEREDLATGAGRDPAAPSTVRFYDYRGTTLALLPVSFTPFSGGYGVNATTGPAGY